MYVDAILDRKFDKIRIAERDLTGQRMLRNIPAQYVFYYEHPAGTHRSLFGHSLKRFVSNSGQQFRVKLNEHDGCRIFESDINPVFRALATNYRSAEAPALHLGFFDIEAGFDQDRGFAPTDDPFNEVTAITLYRTYDNKLLSFVLKPPTFTDDAAQTVVDEFADTLLFTDEKQLLLAFLAAIDDIDVLTSWNGSAYDVPYLVNRVAMLIDRNTTKKFCLWDQLPAEREYKNKFGKLVKTYDFVGRVHLDYLELYAKHNPQQRQSYALNAIGELEVGDTKVPYDGSLDDLYKKDFRKFIEYNRQDVMLMVKIDRKLKYIELSNQVAHANCVLLKTTMGSVALIEQAIINEMHDRGLVVPNRKSDDSNDSIVIDMLDDDDDDEHGGHSPVVGAYVANPKVGVHEYIGCVDINSLYPSAIRALNMSPETLVGQVRMDHTMQLINERVAKLTKTHRAEAWDGLFSTVEVADMHAQNTNPMQVDFFDMLTDHVETKQMTGKELYDYIFDPANHVCITANGTIFRTDVEGIIPGLLARRYFERKEMQKKQHEYEAAASVETDAVMKQKLLDQADFWNSRQQATKIWLNSVYGALLNIACRFGDDRLGQSTTLSGRSVVRHMAATINELVTGSYDHTGAAVQYGDTDSVYFTVVNSWKHDPAYAEFDWSKENVIRLYDLITEEVNQTFAAFMQRTFNTSAERGAIIRAGRELVASKALFIRKKKYAVLMIDKEGKRLDQDGKPGKLKAMGLDLKRSDTPPYMQKFLEKLLLDVLTDTAQQTMYDNIRQFRTDFKERPGWEKGSPKKVSDLTGYAAKLRKNGKIALQKAQDYEKVRLPGHVLASMNWNMLCDMFHDHYALRVTDGMRIIVCKLKPNSFGMTSIAYPTDEEHLPVWFTGLPFDDEAMEETIVDNKIENLVGVLRWDLQQTKQTSGDEFFAWGS